MAKRRPSKKNNSADGLYQKARDRWAEAVDLSLYDSEEVISPVIEILNQALRKDRNHVKSLALLSDLLMEMGRDRDASMLVAQLRDLEPDAKAHQKKEALLKKKWSKKTFDEIRDYVEMKWLTTEDW
jgi:cytochrome c-type biogenesis protein CcmH/NrfG